MGIDTKVTEGLTFDELLARHMQDPEFAKLWRFAQPAYALSHLVVCLRIDHGLSVQELAERAGLKPRLIDAVEDGDYRATVGTLCSILDALGLELDVKAVPR